MGSSLRIGLFALTGFGTPVLRALHGGGMSPCMVVTRQEPDAYPYYPERPITEEARELGISVFLDAEGEEAAKRDPPDVLLVASYHRVIPSDAFRQARWAFNIHPSLLPRYRGASPCFWALREGESETGVTVHVLTDETDRGDIVWQRAVEVSADETQGTLRRKLADVFAVAVVELMEVLDRGNIDSRPQDESLSTWQPRLRPEDRVLDLGLDPRGVERQFRALSPFPGALYDGRAVRGVTIAEDPSATAPVDAVRVRCTGGEIILSLEDQQE